MSAEALAFAANFVEHENARIPAGEAPIYLNETVLEQVAHFEPNNVGFKRDDHGRILRDAEPVLPPADAPSVTWEERFAHVTQQAYHFSEPRLVTFERHTEAPYLTADIEVLRIDLTREGDAAYTPPAPEPPEGYRRRFPERRNLRADHGRGVAWDSPLYPPSPPSGAPVATDGEFSDLVREALDDFQNQAPKEASTRFVLHLAYDEAAGTWGLL